jgi:uncharacterized integral membrane protein
MHFLKTLFWVVLAIGVVLFARENWVPVELKLWSGLIAEVKLPFLLFVAFLLGFVPTYLLYRGRMWSVRRQLTRPEAVSVANQPSPLAQAPAAPAPAPASAPLHPPEPSPAKEGNQPGLMI